MTDRKPEFGSLSGAVGRPGRAFGENGGVRRVRQIYRDESRDLDEITVLRGSVSNN